MGFHIGFFEIKWYEKLSLPTKEIKAKFNTAYLIFRKKINLPSGTLLYLSNYVDIECGSAEYNTAESLTNKYKLFKTKSKQTINFSNIPFSLTPSKKYIIIEAFKDELKSLKNILNETKNLLRKQEINEIKNDTKRKLNMPDDEIGNISEHLDVDLTTLTLRCEIYKNFEGE